MDPVWTIRFESISLRCKFVQIFQGAFENYKKTEVISTTLKTNRNVEQIKQITNFRN